VSLAAEEISRRKFNHDPRVTAELAELLESCLGLAKHFATVNGLLDLLDELRARHPDDPAFMLDGPAQTVIHDLRNELLLGYVD